jgi:hypothetical protein
VSVLRMGGGGAGKEGGGGSAADAEKGGVGMWPS